MSIQNVVRQTIDSIRFFANMITNAIVSSIKATTNFIIRFPQNLPKYLNGIWRAFKVGVNLGIALLNLSVDIGKYVLQNLLPDIAKGLYRLTKYCLQNIPKVMKAFYDVAKFLITHIPDISEGIYNICQSIIKFSYNLTKSIAIGIYDNLGAIARWLIRTSPQILANTIGIIVGVLYAPFAIGLELVREGMHKILGVQSDSISSVSQTSINIAHIDQTAESALQVGSNNGLTMQYAQQVQQSLETELKPKTEQRVGIVEEADIEPRFTGTALKK